MISFRRQMTSRVKGFLKNILLVSIFVLAGGCMKWDYGKTEDFEESIPGEVSTPGASGDLKGWVSGEGLFILNEGNMDAGNASLSYYKTFDKKIENEVFKRANGFKIGDVAQSMVIRKNIGWITVNNSHVIFAIDITTFKEVGRITNLTSPRYIHFLSDEKAYVTQLWDNRIFIVNPKTYQITGHINCPNMTTGRGSTEQMVQLGRYVYTNCWSYQKRILKIDTHTDKVVAEVEVGIQPTSLVLDCNNKLWTITDGGFEGSIYGYEAPMLVRINPETMSVEQKFTFQKGEHPSELQINAQRDKIYWINNDIWQMGVNDKRAPLMPIIETKGTIYYGLSVSPTNEDIYVGDAIDYQQQGTIYRYTKEGQLVDRFMVGITPSAFCWR